MQWIVIKDVLLIVLSNCNGMCNQQSLVLRDYLQDDSNCCCPVFKVLFSCDAERESSLVEYGGQRGVGVHASLV